MPITFNERLIAYLALISGLTISVVAEYYSIVGFTAIFAAAVIPVVIMGIALGVGKIAATVWLKQNWNIAPWSVRVYLLTAIIVLMAVTSLGIFGFLSKAHSDQSLVSGDVQAKIAVYDEKIKIAKENIDANRKALKQMDEAVDQVMGRSTSETGADKAVSIRRSQAKERTRLQTEIAAEQKAIAELNEVRAPISAEVRKVEAEVGPIKYIAQFVYGETSEGILEKAVTWVIILLIVVFDPLAVILLLSSQISFQNFREREIMEGDSPRGTTEVVDPKPPTVTDLAEGNSPEGADVVRGPTVAYSVEDADDEESILEKHPYLNQPFAHFKNLEPMVHKPVPTEIKFVDGGEHPSDTFEYEKEEVVEEVPMQEVEPSNDKLEAESPDVERPGDYLTPPEESLFVQNEEQKQSNLWSTTAKAISQEEYQSAALSRQELTLQEWIAKIKSKEITMADVPEHLLLDIRARI
jgi:Tfp pilus assembly protein PilO